MRLDALVELLEQDLPDLRSSASVRRQLAQMFESRGCPDGVAAERVGLPIAHAAANQRAGTRKRRGVTTVPSTGR